MCLDGRMASMGVGLAHGWRPSDTVWAMARLAAGRALLRGQLKGRLTLSDGERATLGEIGQRLGHKALGEGACLCSNLSDHRGRSSATAIVSHGRKLSVLGIRSPLSLSKTQTRTYRWCSPPRIGKLSTQPALWTSRGIGASFFNAKCGRTSLLCLSDIQTRTTGIVRLWRTR